MKNLLIVFLLLIAGLKGFSQDIAVTYPEYENEFVGGQTITVTWTSVAGIPKVKLVLNVNNVANEQMVLIDSVANTGSCQVVLPVFDNDVRPSIYVYPLNGQVVVDGAIFYILTTAAYHVEAGANRSICPGQPTWLGAFPPAHGGTPPYTYSWSTGDDDSFVPVTPVTNTTYYITATDNNGVVAIDSVTVTMSNNNPPLRATLSTARGYLPDTVTVNIAGGLAPYSIEWPFIGNAMGDTVGNKMFLNSFEPWYAFYTRVTDAAGCTTLSDSTFYGQESAVWPGDANNNGLADNMDLLPIGLAYNYTGFMRGTQDVNWYGHPANDWMDSTVAGVDNKHIDCNGDGIINADDTLAIIQNFGLIHPKNNENAAWQANEPALYIELDPDTTYAGDTLYANVLLGDANIAANDVYGLAFTINYDASVVDPAKTSVVFGNSWLGDASDKISIAKDLYQQSQIKCAVTRIDHTSRSGAGQIGQATFVITTDNINGKNMAYYKMHVWLSDVVMIDNQGNEIPVNEGQDSTEVEFEPLSVGSLQLAAGSLKIQPNPANDVVQITVTKELLGGNLKVMDMEGRNLIEKVVNTPTFKLETDRLSAGIYLLQVNTTYGKITRRLMIAR